jgi:hypothetical protein
MTRRDGPPAAGPALHELHDLDQRYRRQGVGGNDRQLRRGERDGVNEDPQKRPVERGQLENQAGWDGRPEPGVRKRRSSRRL